MRVQSGIKLPRKLLEEIGQERIYAQAPPSSRAVRSRKDRRKAARVEKKVKRGRSSNATNPHQSQSSSSSLRQKRQTQPVQHLDSRKPSTNLYVSKAKQASILDTTVLNGKSLGNDGGENHENSMYLDESDFPSKKVGATQLDVPKAQRDELGKEDIEIRALEKALGIKGKHPRSFAEDGLEDLLGDLSDLGENINKTAELRIEEREWLTRKRSKILETKLSTSKELVSAEDDASPNKHLLQREEPTKPSSLNNEVFEGFPDELDEQHDREDPYKAPVSNGPETPHIKYMPPSLRSLNSIADPLSHQTRRRIQGLLNKLSDTNLLSVLTEMEGIYRHSARQFVSASLIDFLMGIVCSSAGLSDAFLVLYAAFVASMYKIVGTDFGAQVVQRIVEDFEGRKSDEAQLFDSSKSLSNIISFLAELYNFQVITSGLVYDYIRQFVSHISEINTELLLRIVRHSGSQLRQDDPTTLRDIVIQLQSTVGKIGKESLSIRTQFMLETISDLKNNKLKTGIASSNLLSEHVTKLKKLIGSLNTRSLKATEPLHITIEDIKNSNKRGRWWLVGSSYRDNIDTEEPGVESIPGELDKSGNVDEVSVDLLRLAREQRMNTNIRRSIFVTIMSANDYKDAQLRLLKLNLKRSQELEIPKVLVHCVSMEETFNPYYSLIATQLCADRRFKMAFQFLLWDLFKRMGEVSESETEELDIDAELDMRTIVNLGRMYGSLITNERLGFRIFKNLNFVYLRPKSRIFLEILFISFIIELRQQYGLDRTERKLRDLISGIEKDPDLISGLQYFITKILQITDVAGNKREKKTVLWGCSVLENALDTANLDMVKG